MKSKDDVKRILEEEKKKYGKEDIKYQYRHHKHENFEGLVVLCQKCKTSKEELGKKKLTFIRNKYSGEFRLNYFDNKHNHTFW